MREYGTGLKSYNPNTEGGEKGAKTAKCEKRIPNLEIPLGLARKELRIADACSTRMALFKNFHTVGSCFKLHNKKHDIVFFNPEKR